MSHVICDNSFGNGSLTQVVPWYMVIPMYFLQVKITFNCFPSFKNNLLLLFLLYGVCVYVHMYVCV
jgi:hypothetical protein